MKSVNPDLKKKGYLDRHIEMKHNENTQDTNFECEVCGKKMKHVNSIIERHMKTHLQCNICQSSFDSEKAMKEHKPPTNPN